MDNKRTALERAFELARSGACSSLGDLTHCLKLEGHSLNQIVGPSLYKQLRALITEAQGEPMPRGPKGQERSANDISNAVKAMRRATGEEKDAVTEDGKDKAAQSLGRRGGKARAEKKTAGRRSEIAKKASAKRWQKN